MIAAGIPEDEIIFAPKSDSKNRETIFRDINAAKYRVVIASTRTLGTGANIQQNLYALHHIDVPWKPSDFEQREGRILRQGNNYGEVEIFNYVTEGTLDSYLYQTVTDKARFIAQLLDDKAPARVSEDCDEKVLTFGEIQAAAEGNPDFKRRIELSNEVAELTMLKNAYIHETVVTKEQIAKIPKQLAQQEKRLAGVQQDKAAAQKYSNLYLRTESGRVISDRKEVNAYLLDMARSSDEHAAVSVNGFQISVQKDSFSGDVRFAVTGSETYFCDAGVTEHQDNYQRLSNLFGKGISERESKVQQEIVKLQENLAQAKERAGIPFAHEEELAEKTDELQKLEEKLSGLSVQEDDAADAEEEVIVETAEEKSEREKLFSVDDDDYQPTPDEDNPAPKRM